MAKITKYNIVFDSELEIKYYEYLHSKGITFIYHPEKSIYINSKNRYYPDFIEIYDDTIFITETKGYNPYSKLKDEMIHNAMLDKSTSELRSYIQQLRINHTDKDIKYRKIKFLNNIGFVDFDFKNPNTLLNKKREKVKHLELENKELKKALKDHIRYYEYMHKEKLTKAQQKWVFTFDDEYKKNQDHLV